jgi:hypothetical protein
VSNASDDFPDPETPVITENRDLGNSTSIPRRLFWRAPRTTMARWEGEFTRAESRLAANVGKARTPLVASVDGPRKPADFPPTTGLA